MTNPTVNKHRNIRLAERLATILMRLYAGENLSRQQLTEEFGISERTVFRDLGRLAGLIEQDGQGKYRISAVLRQQMRQESLRRFAKLLGADGLALGEGKAGFDMLYDALLNETVLIKDLHYESMVPSSAQFVRLEHAIRNKQLCSFVYKGKRRLVAPYRLVNWQGFWYLAGVEQEKLKAFIVDSITELLESETRFEPDPAVIAEIEAEDGVWYSTEKQTVIIEVAAQAAHYFERRPIFPRQQLLKKWPDGRLHLQATIGPIEQILPLLRSWLPCIKVISPAEVFIMLVGTCALCFQTQDPGSTDGDRCSD